jgi:hypothetical protein
MISRLVVECSKISRLPEVMMADFIAAGDQCGCRALSSATTPDTCGAAIDVPDMIPYLFPVTVCAGSIFATGPCSPGNVRQNLASFSQRHVPSENKEKKKHILHVHDHVSYVPCQVHALHFFFFFVFLLRPKSRRVFLNPPTQFISQQIDPVGTGHSYIHACINSFLFFSFLLYYLF